ncbi:MAG: DUF5343 domain-containing protein [Chloroflexota bacterium]|nr:DUF5343 domain-containing protein [Chloroflexota bacterium]
MAQEQADVRVIPPYVPWKTFKGFIDGLRANMPSRIDRSVMGTMSGAMQGQLIAALRFMGLVTDNGTPTPRLREFVKAEGDDRTERLKEMFFDAYQSITEAAADPGEPDFNFLDNGTYRQLVEAFATTGATGDTLRKCVAFFLSMARDADVVLSPHFSSRGSRSSLAPRRKRVAGRQAPARAEDEDDFSEAPPPPPPKTKFEILMEKFPAFNPEWSAEVQAKWFDAFERMQKTDVSLATDPEDANERSMRAIERK